MGNYIDLTGHRFERLTVIEISGKDKCGYLMWRCKCDCGNEKIIRGHRLRQNITKSCGCLRKELSKQRKLTHGKARSRLYSVWIGMKQRCYDSNASNYYRYGGRGIRVCDEWLSEFMTFSDWALENGYSPDLTIDRMDNDGNYDPSNCRWATLEQQNNNKSNSRRINYAGKTLTLAQWSRQLNIDVVVLHQRLSHLGWSVNRAFSEPLHSEFSNKKD